MFYYINKLLSIGKFCVSIFKWCFSLFDINSKCCWDLILDVVEDYSSTIEKELRF